MFMRMGICLAADNEKQGKRNGWQETPYNYRHQNLILKPAK
jgi:hypothetical protein